MTKPRIAFFSMPDPGHFRRLVPIIAGLAGSGVAVDVLSHRQFEAQIEALGARFINLFSRYPLERADPGSLPRSCRYVTYAAHYVDAVCEDIRRLEPAVIVYGTFAVIGYLVATRLRIPYVNVCAGHNVDPKEFLRTLPDDLRVEIHPNCWAAAARLRDEYGIRDASPFSFIATLSPFLNVYCEPPEFLTPAERTAFEPVAFFGSIVREEDAAAAPERPARNASDELRVYVCFGTIIWRHYPAQALEVLRAASDAFAEMEHVRALISLGGYDPSPAALASLEKPNVRVERYVDQWEVLRETDVFLTHHGLNSTHEAIFHRVPMISLPVLLGSAGSRAPLPGARSGASSGGLRARAGAPRGRDSGARRGGESQRAPARAFADCMRVGNTSHGGERCRARARPEPGPPIALMTWNRDAALISPSVDHS